MVKSAQFTDSEGFRWHVQESARDGASARGWLYFMSQFITKKLPDPPPGWRSLRWWELEELCDRAQAVKAGAPREASRARSLDFERRATA